MLLKKFLRTFILTIIIFAFGFLFLAEANSKNSPKAINGYIDLSQSYSSSEIFSHKLDGEWEFYWKQLLNPRDLAMDNLSSNRQIINVPAPWNGLAEEIETKLNTAVSLKSEYGIGYATYRLVVYTPKIHPPLALDFSAPRAAHKLWINGSLVSMEGVVSAQENLFVARYYDKIIPVEPVDGAIEIVIEAANYLQYKGGLRHSIVLAEESSLRHKYLVNNGKHFLTLGAMWILAIFYMLLFSIRRSEKTTLYFALFLITLSFRELVIDSIILLQFFPNLPQSFILRIEYLTIFAIGFYTWFIYSLMPERIPKNSLKIITACWLIEVIVIIFSPPWFFSKYMAELNIFFFVILIYLLFVIFEAVRNKADSAKLLLGVHIVFTLAVVNDQLFYADIIQTGDFYSISTLIMMVLQTALIIERFMKTFRAVEYLNIQLDTKDKLKDEFLAEVSHELLTPIHGIHGFLESISESASGRLVDSERELLDTALVINRRLGNLVTDIQDFLKVKHKDLVLNYETLNLKNIVDVIVSICRVLSKDKAVALVNNVDSDIFVHADKDKLQQILHNIIENAVKYTNFGHITIYAEIKDKDGEDKVAIHIVDTGIGIAEEYYQKIFEPYTKVSGEKTTKGSGLGLSIANDLVTLQGGSIELKSKVGKGSRFTIFLPKPKEKPVLKSLPKDINIEQLPVKNYNNSTGEHEAVILIVDDEPTNLTVLEHHFEELPYKIDKASDGFEALEKINKTEYDLVILDLMMPGISGYEVCFKIRERFTLLELPVILLTVKNKSEDIVLALSNGANDYLSKPFDKKELLARAYSLVLIKKSLKKALTLQRDFLSMQIKPHFFYNVINTIMGFCLTDPHKAYELLGEFSNLVGTRLRLSEIENFVSLGEEIKMIMSYLKIVKARFGEMIDYEIKCDVPDSYQIPPFILEPLVENAVKHGIYEKIGGGKVLIDIRDTGKGVRFSVSDNGVGIDPGRLQDILNSRKEHIGIGLSNIQRRLEFQYQRELHVESFLGEGTTFWFIIPHPK